MSPRPLARTSLGCKFTYTVYLAVPKNLAEGIIEADNSLYFGTTSYDELER